MSYTLHTAHIDSSPGSVSQIRECTAELIKYAKQNIYGNKIAIGMGAGSISNWIRDLPKYIK